MATQEGIDEFRGKLAKVIDRISAEPAYRRELLENPGAALAAAGLDLSEDQAEVTGHATKCPSGSCNRTCGISCSHDFPQTCTYTCRLATRLNLAD